jgi:DNA-binding NarL/FixJ family response regulator
MPNYTTLIIEDFEKFRRFVASTLQGLGEFQVIYQASDGLEGVQRAKELQPDLILLDIGLPTLNGIEAARQIRKVSPSSKILFLTQESSLEVVQEALGVGAQGYLLKFDMAGELLLAVDAVLQGKQFLSSRLTPHQTDRVDYPGKTDVGSRFSDPQSAPREADRFHVVGCYQDDASLVDDFIRFVEAALKIRNVIIVVATESHWRGVFHGLQSRGWDMVAAMREGTCIYLESYELLSSFVVDDWPDGSRLRIFSDDLIENIAKAHTGAKIVICGECAPLLLAQGKAEAAIEVERLWDELVVRRHGIDLLCGYATNQFLGEGNSPIFKRICAEHSAAYSL